MVHDEKNELDSGDQVLIRQCRPHSKTKHWEFWKFIQKEPAAGYARKHPEFKATKEQLKQRALEDKRKEKELAEEKIRKGVNVSKSS